jgi:hypothetical protein
VVTVGKLSTSINRTNDIRSNISSTDQSSPGIISIHPIVVRRAKDAMSANLANLLGAKTKVQ